MQPGEGSLDYPADLAKPGPMLLFAAGEDWLHAALAQSATVLVGVIAAVAVEGLWTPARLAGLAGDWADRIDQRLQLRDVVAVAARGRDGERHAFGVDDRVVL